MTGARPWALLLLLPLVQETKDDAASVWEFDSARVEGDRVKPAIGPYVARSTGPILLSSDKPPSILLGGGLGASGPPKSKVPKSGYLAIGMDIAASGLPSRELSVEAWVRIDRPEKHGGIVGLFRPSGSEPRGWLLGFTERQFIFALSTESQKSATTMAARRVYQTGAWYHLLGTYDGAEMKLYVDGALVASDRTQSGKITYPTKTPYAIGACWGDEAWYPMTGRLARVAVWKRALSDEEARGRWKDLKTRFPEIEPAPLRVVDWPTHLRDNRRSALTDSEPVLPLRLRWIFKARQPPRPAWPPEAKQDFYNGKPVHRPRTTFDHAFHVVAAGNLVCFGSSADDQVYGLDAQTGRARWTFFAEGPVRLAPSIAEGRVLFGSDDGFVYCLDAELGTLQWKLRAGPADRRLPGNGRVISAWPVRSGVLVEEGQAHYCAGLFPGKDGAVHGMADLKTGRKGGEVPLSVSSQGYMEERGGKLFVSTGRDLAGAFVAELRRQGKGLDKEVSSIEENYPFAFIGAGSVRFGGGDGKVAAFSADDGRKLWFADVEGRAHSLAFARGRLLVSTDRGFIYSFSSEAGETTEVAPPATAEFPYPDQAAKDRCAEEANSILKRSGARQGYALILGAGDGRLACELARATSLQIVAVESDPSKIATARRALEAAGLCGRVAVHVLDPAGDLPYTDYLFNLVVGSGKREEMLRVTRPEGGVAIFGRGEGDVVRRGPLEGAGEWTHLYADPANTASSGDRLVAGDFRLQWFGLPGPEGMIDRHHRTGAPLSKNGRLFVAGNDRITGLDAYNGTILWEAPVPGSRRMAIFRDCGNMALAGDALYIATGERCLRLAPDTGRVERTHEVPAAADKAPREWGYLALADELLVASSVKSGASQREHSRRMVTSVTYWDFKPTVTSDSLFAIDRASGDLRWAYAPKGAILNPTITIGGGRVYFVESPAAETLTKAQGRMPLGDLIGKGGRVVALDLKTGRALWSESCDLSAVQHNLYGVYSLEKWALVGSRNGGKDANAASVFFDVRVLEAATGKESWFKTQNQGVAINGEHGEQDLHPVAFGGRLYVEPRVYDLKSGAELETWEWKPRRGCGTMSASASTLFFRNQNPCSFDPAVRQVQRVTIVTRPGCWINMIPAGGLLLIPEGSSGCSCDFAVQGSLAFLPAPWDKSK